MRHDYSRLDMTPLGGCGCVVGGCKCVQLPPLEQLLQFKIDALMRQLPEFEPRAITIVPERMPLVAEKRRIRALRAASVLLYLAIVAWGLWGFFAPIVRGEVIGMWAAPGPDCERAIVAAIDNACHSIDYQMYNFTAAPVGDALIAAADRGVEVTILLDHTASRSPHCQAARCARAGCTVLVDWSHPIAHNKVRIFDRRLLISGSYNDSAQAHKNAENAYAENDPRVVAWFLDRFDQHAAHAIAWKSSLAKDRARTRAKQK